MIATTMRKLNRLLLLLLAFRSAAWAFQHVQLPPSSTTTRTSFSISRRHHHHRHRGAAATSRLTLAAAIDLDESTPRDVNGMDEWAAACGVQRCDGFQLVSQDGVDYGVATAADVPGGVRSCSFPARCCSLPLDADRSCTIPRRKRCWSSWKSRTTYRNSTCF